MVRQIRTQKTCKPARHTHFLESTDSETSQDTEVMQASKVNSQPGKPRQRDKSGHRKNASQQRALTNWRTQTE